MEVDSGGLDVDNQAADSRKEDKGTKERRHNSLMETGRRKVCTVSFSSGAFILVIILLGCIHLGTTLKCYHCLERPKSTEKHLACAYFDRSDKFHKECTHSSFCMKRTSKFQLHNGSYVTIYVHKCADQSHKTMIQDSNGDWKWAQLFRADVYNEGCFQHNTPSMLTTDNFHCFCSTDFCNAAPVTIPQHRFMSISWILQFLPFLLVHLL